MLVTSFAAIIASLIYFYASLVLWNRLQSKDSKAIDWPRNRFLLYILFAAILQFFSFANSLLNGQVIMLGLGTVLSLITWLSVVSLLITNLKQTTENLGVFIFPLAGLSSILTFMPGQSAGLPLELGLHVILSISAYSILGLAGAQAILYSIQEKRFQQKKLTTLFKALPPLQVMEATMIQFVTIGFIILSMALITGAYFIEDMFAQHLIHKTFFAILAWVMYGLFLLGNNRFGWRGQIATKFTIWAYFLLVLSYIGTETILIYIN